MADKVTIDIDGRDVSALAAAPSGTGPFAAIVVAHHGPGLDQFTGDFLDQLAAAGYVAVAPDFYHRAPGGEIKDRVAALDDENIIRDIGAGADYLRARPDVAAGRIGIAGHCLGGRNALLGAEAVSGFSACAVFYGGNIMLGRGRDAPTPFQLIGDIPCPVAGFFGNEDDNPSPEDVDRIDAEMDRHGIIHEFYRYDGAGHAFQNFVAPERYREDASNDAQAKLLDFFGRTLSAG